MKKFDKYLWEINKLFRGKRYITIKPTLRCNLECDYCSVVNAYKYYPISYLTPPPYQELSKDWWIKLIKRVNPDLITISGGEPGIYEGIHEIINYAVKRKCLVQILSNLTVLDEFKKIEPTWRVYFLHTIHKGVSASNLTEIRKLFYVDTRVIKKNPKKPRKEIKLITWRDTRFRIMYAPDGTMYDSCDGVALKDNHIITDVS